MENSEYVPKNVYSLFSMFISQGVRTKNSNVVMIMVNIVPLVLHLTETITRVYCRNLNYWINTSHSLLSHHFSLSSLLLIYNTLYTFLFFMQWFFRIIEKVHTNIHTMGKSSTDESSLQYFGSLLSFEFS